MNKYMSLLGHRAKDKVTDFEGVVTTVAFDLYGCIQVVLVPAADKDGKMGEGNWFDAKRIELTSTSPVMEAPDFETLAAGKEKGPAAKPARRF